MPDHTAENHLDPRIRRSRKLLQSALRTLLESKSFSDITITDICKQADVARVTFYQHYESKEALLLAGVADFFASIYQAIDPDALDHFLETGELGALITAQEMDLADPGRLRMVRAALQYAGSPIRKLTIASFLETYSQQETELDAQETLALATFYIGGMLTLLEQYLQGRLAISPAQFQAATLNFLRILRQGTIQSHILRHSPRL